MKKFLIYIISFYQKYLSFLLGKNCRFQPSCSTYAKESIERHGSLVGSFYAVVRIFKCGPWSGGGVDEVKK
ncbi:membrane protein insertion efficiency factor YidD [Gammaproteobacteria bacterium]|nr:membrane protein insertion efficiency factor YidD [Gammaproteobacteria bacterium]MDB9737896.1 membrane protein insertion efficiency factor YidD [Gammaproteobacteria bacterium]MDC3398224.1 membrane protein insertion efficiency factor YidD [Gammaproteobacteria bacterium]